MLYHISNAIGKEFHKIAATDVIEYGAIAIITDTSAFQRAKGRGIPIPYLELADYYSDRPVKVDRFLTGDALTVFCRAQFRFWQKANKS